MGPKWHSTHAQTHTNPCVYVHMHTRALHNCGASLLPVCVPPHSSSLAVGDPTVWASDEFLMAATWHCHVAFSMTVASVSIFASVVHTRCVCNELSKDCVSDK